MIMVKMKTEILIISSHDLESSALKATPIKRLVPNMKQTWALENYIGSGQYGDILATSFFSVKNTCLVMIYTSQTFTNIIIM